MYRASLAMRPLLGALGFYALSGLFGTAQAQPAPAPGPSGSTAGASSVEQVVVTARRVEERLQDVPTAITAISGKQLDVLKPRTLLDLNGAAPNVQIGLVGAGAGAAAIYIRGLGYADIEKGQNPSVGLLIDDVVIGTNTAQLIDAFDLQQIEIDRGPQGIFYGKNTTAGAISVHRSRPTHKYNASGSIAFGDYGQRIGRLILNAPVGDTAGIKLGVSHRYRDGYGTNIYTGKSYGRDEVNTVTASFDWDPLPKVNLLATFDYTRESGEGTPVALGDKAAAAVLGPVLAPAGIVFNEYGSPYIPGVTKPLGVRQYAADFPDRNYLTQKRYALNASWDSPIGKFVSITAYIDQQDDAEQDFDGSCGYSMLLGPCPVLANPLLPFLHTSRPQDYKQFSEEVRFSHDFGRYFKAQTGVYYFHDEIRAVQLTRTAVPGVPVTAPLTRQSSGENNDSVSVFGNVDYNPTNKLGFSFGARYISESKDFFNGYNLLYIPGVGPATVALLPQFQRSKSFGNLITRISAAYKVTPTNNIYLTRSEGFRSGGFSPRSTLSESIPGQSNYSPGADYSGFEPETNVAYEVGSKNIFLEGQLTLNTAAFHTEDSGFQQTSVVVTPGYGPGTNTYIANLNSVVIDGFELETLYSPRWLHGLTLSGSFGYQDAQIKDGRVPGVVAPIGPGATAGTPGSSFDFTGKTLTRVPPYTVSLRGDYLFDLGPGRMELNAGYSWQDDFVFAFLGNTEDVQNAYGLVDASATYSWKNYRLQVSAKNLTDQIYLSNTLPAVFFQGWGQPRTFLVELQARF